MEDRRRKYPRSRETLVFGLRSSVSQSSSMQKLLLPFFTLLTIGLFAQEQTAGRYQSEQTIQVDYQYLLFRPDNTKEAKDGKWPLVVFLHGAGERGDDLEKLKVHGPPKLAAANPDFPCLVLSPLCPTGKRWDAQALNFLLDEIVKNEAVDTNRIYLTGLSMGGQGTWDWALLAPKRFAAIIPICGGDYMHSFMVEAIQHLPIWVFHGAMDQVVPLENSVRIVRALKNIKANVRFTVYPEAGHDSWTETYDNPEVWDWLLQQQKQP